MSEVAEAQSLIDLIDYQTGSIVSKTLFDKPTGTLTLFAFDKAQGLSEHTAPFDALAYLMDGSAAIGVGGTTHVAAPGDLVRLPAGVPHWVRAEGPFKMMLIMLRQPKD